jgi:hypothetical protein
MAGGSLNLWQPAVGDHAVSVSSALPHLRHRFRPFGVLYPTANIAFVSVEEPEERTTEGLRWQA